MPLSQDSTSENGQWSQNSVRFLKYLTLLCAVIGILLVTFDCYSFYLARRSIDAELDAQKMPSLESLVLARQRNRDAIVSLYETRCVERQLIALHRTMDGVGAGLRDASRELYAVANTTRANLKQFADGVLQKAAIDRMTPGAAFDIDVVDQELAKSANLVEGMNKDNEKYKALLARWAEDKKKYIDVSKKYDPMVLSEIEKKSDSIKRINLTVESISALEKRFERLKKDTGSQRQREDQLGEVLARYDTWTGALVSSDLRSGLEKRAGITAKAYEALDKELERVNCEDVGKYEDGFRELGHDLREWRDKPFWKKLYNFPRMYSEWLLVYFEQAPAAQTLFVTLLIGGLGALTLNMLRLSKVGWWREHADPPWGEIFIGPFLGALAAFGIYLVGSAGLLLTGDVKNGPTTLSASFIGLLGFVSGLLYDQAFGRVRRFGSQLFSGDEANANVGSGPEDVQLAKLLQDAGASLMASLVLKHRLGLALLAENEFTFVVPSDLALEKVTLQWWTDVNNDRKPAFKQWYRRHHSEKKRMSSDVTATQPLELKMDDGKSITMKLDDKTGLQIGGSPVQKADLLWERGVIHVVGGDLPSA